MNKELICPECKANIIRLVQSFLIRHYYTYDTNYEGKALELISKDDTNEGNTEVWFECVECGYSHESIWKFRNE